MLRQACHTMWGAQCTVRTHCQLHTAWEACDKHERATQRRTTYRRDMGCASKPTPIHQNTFTNAHQQQAVTLNMSHMSSGALFHPCNIVVGYHTCPSARLLARQQTQPPKPPRLWTQHGPWQGHASGCSDGPVGPAVARFRHPHQWHQLACPCQQPGHNHPPLAATVWATCRRLDVSAAILTMVYKCADKHRPECCADTMGPQPQWTCTAHCAVPDTTRNTAWCTPTAHTTVNQPPWPTMDHRLQWMASSTHAFDGLACTASGMPHHVGSPGSL